MTVEAFARAHLVRVNEGARGAALSLREVAGSGDSGGECSLLREGRECATYEARPRQCREFPFWPSILEDRSAFERARAVCPGIVPLPTAEVRERAFRELASLYEDADERIAALAVECVQRGVCCHFESYGHELWATALEVDYALRCHPDPPPPEGIGRCPYHVEGRCAARVGRPLGCRTFFCDPVGEAERQALHEELLARIRLIERKTGYPASYGEFPELLRRRRSSGESGTASSDEEHER